MFETIKCINSNFVTLFSEQISGTFIDFDRRAGGNRNRAGRSSDAATGNSGI